MKMKKTETMLRTYEQPQLTALLVVVEQGFSGSDESQIDPAEGENDFGEF